jgi:diguanylate cyclase (GGDEF)-like protein
VIKPTLALSLQRKLHLIGAVLSLGMMVVGAVAWLTLARTHEVTRTVVEQASAMGHLQTADMAHDAMRSAVYTGLLVGQVPEMSLERARKDAAKEAQNIREALSALSKAPMDDEQRKALLAVRASAERYVAAGERVMATIAIDRRAAVAELPAFHAAFDALLIQLEQQTEQLRKLNDDALTRVDEVGAVANNTVGLAALICLLTMAALVSWVGHTIRRSLQAVQTVAAAVAAGDIERRATIEADDEVGRLGLAVNAMADKLHAMLNKALGDASRHHFAHELNEALEMADSEQDAYLAVQRAMAKIDPQRPMELLAGAPGCGVDSPFSCQAVRRGNSVSFPDSEALNACPRLRDRAGATAAISAACVPLHFMGRALGVLHTSGPLGQSLGEEQLVQLTALGNQAAARIGVVRAFERTQLQAATDAATGLANRRTLEAKLRELMRQKQTFAFVMADLDRFKMLNDTYGHLVGDQALLLFAQTMKAAVRDIDTVARWGGEEFAIVLVGSDAAAAGHWAERARAQLAQAVGRSKVPKFTVSLGIADSSMAERMEDMLRIADEALYASKDGGRDRATIGATAAANEPRVRQASEHEERIDVAQMHAS